MYIYIYISISLSLYLSLSIYIYIYIYIYMASNKQPQRHSQLSYTQCVRESTAKIYPYAPIS